MGFHLYESAMVRWIKIDVKDPKKSAAYNAKVSTV